MGVVARLSIDIHNWNFIMIHSLVSNPGYTIFIGGMSYTSAGDTVSVFPAPPTERNFFEFITD